MAFLSTFDHTNSMTDNIIDRDNLQDAYINEIIDGMDIKDLMRIVYDNLEQNLEQYSVDELIEEVEEYYPHLLEDWYKPCPFSIYIFYWERQPRVDGRTTYTQNGHRGQNRVL